MGVVQVKNTLISKSTREMNIVRKLVLLTLQHNIKNKAQHIPTKLNKIADSISRSQWATFAPGSELNKLADSIFRSQWGTLRNLSPEVEMWPTQLPKQIWEISLLSPNALFIAPYYKTSTELTGLH